MLLNKTTVVIASILVALLISSTSCARKSHNLPADDDDEFSEFDNLDDDPVVLDKKPSKQADKKTNDDFVNLDSEAVVGDDDGDNDADEFEKPSVSKADQSNRPNKYAKKDENLNKQQAKKPSVNLDIDEDLDAEEFEHFIDDEEFENFETGEFKEPAATKEKAKPNNEPKMPSLKIADVPKHLMTNGNWQNYVYEIVMLVVIFIYFSNYIYGKSKNNRLATTWYQANRSLLESSFAIVGDDGSTTDLPMTKTDSDNADDDTTSSDSPIATLIKESENCYGLWCTGRQHCDGMLIQLKLIKRQDLINGLIMQMAKPQSDQVIFSVEFSSRNDVDNFVFCLSNKKTSSQLSSCYQDIATFCTEKKTLVQSVDYKYQEFLTPEVASNYVVLNEVGEVPAQILDQSFCLFLNKNPHMIDYLLISDQFVGYKTQSNDEQANASTNTTDSGSSHSYGLPKSRCILVLCLNVGGKGLNTSTQDMENMTPAIGLVLRLIEKASSRVRLSKEAKAKSLKRRKEITEQLMKLTNKQRQEEISQRKEDQRRAEKEKIMNESDPEKQKRLEEKELKREKKKNLSKMKQIKIKSM